MPKIIISHRGNLTGKDARENQPDYIDDAIRGGYLVEIDLWFIENEYFLGHDEPQYPVTFYWLADRAPSLFIHCKNAYALERLFVVVGNNPHWNFFSHDVDQYTFTSRGDIWAYPTATLITGAIIAVPEMFYSELEVTRLVLDESKVRGICTDKPAFYRERLSK